MELFYFDQSHNFVAPVINLGYVPYISNFSLKAKTTWWYLGFYFDCMLLFQEHIHYYSTKALTTMMAMHMLGNSTCRLTPKQH